MIRRFVVASTLLVAGSIVSAIAPAMAGTASNNLSVSGTVVANCTISTTGMTFTGYDPVSTHASSDLTATGTVTTTCTNGSPVAITLGQGSNANTGSTDDAPLRRLSDGSGNYLSYSLYQNSGLTTVWGNSTNSDFELNGTGSSVNSTIYGSVAAGQNTAPVGTYNDTVQATVSF